MSNPTAGAPMRLRCESVMRGARKPMEVDLISSSEEVLGEVVPIPTGPIAGKVFWACDILYASTIKRQALLF